MESRANKARTQLSDGSIYGNIGSRAPIAGSKWTRESSRADADQARRRDDRKTKFDGPTPRLRVGKRDVKNSDDPLPRRSRAARFHDPGFSFGKSAQSKRNTVKMDRDQSMANKRALESDRNALLRNPDKTRLSASRLAYLARTAGGTSPKYDKPSPASDTASAGGMKGSGYNMERGSTEQYDSNRSEPGKHENDSGYRTGRSRNDSKMAHSARGVFTSSLLALERDDHSNRRSRDQTRDSGLVRLRDSRLPLSIPYTTPASEFLYGTSVVEAALRSQRVPRRKLYKLYIYTGENRDHVDRDVGIERLAMKKQVEIVRVGNEWLRLMDKMSAGRPHNGYILEASPLPKLPVLSLGALTSRGNEQGFTVALGHQSREEAVINGTSDFIPVPQDSSWRKPFVLVLDSILDPGNLGGIIRTASFLGITAVAISSRNSATFTPIVLKASAGASENVLIFSIDRPAGFITDSKLAGWKIYAAVAPSGKRESNSAAQISTDHLESPLEHNPCILMLGNEGEGLRWNLRSKADIELAIHGSRQRGSVDSLNVSVAAGVLCSAFLRGSRVGHSRASQGPSEQQSSNVLF